MNQSMLSSAKSSSTLGRPRKKAAPNKSKDLSMSLIEARVLQTKLQNLRLEKEIADKKESYEQAFKKISLRNDNLAEEIHEKRLRLQKLELYQDVLDKTKNEEDIVDKIISEFKKLDSYLTFLKEKADNRQSLVTLSGIKPDSAHVINDMLEIGEKLSTPLASSINYLLGNDEETKCLQERIEKLSHIICEQKQSYSELSESLEHLDKIRLIALESADT